MVLGWPAWVRRRIGCTGTSDRPSAPRGVKASAPMVRKTACRRTGSARTLWFDLRNKSANQFESRQNLHRLETSAARPLACLIDVDVLISSGCPGSAVLHAHLLAWERRAGSGREGTSRIRANRGMSPLPRSRPVDWVSSRVRSGNRLSSFRPWSPPPSSGACGRVPSMCGPGSWDRGI